MKLAIKVYGERNSGTNYLEQLIEENFDVQLLRLQHKWHHMLLLKLVRYDIIEDLVFFLQRKQILGWKHGCPRLKEVNEYKKSRLAVVTITKNPYAFLVSLYRKPYHFKGKVASKFEVFITQLWVLRGRDNHSTNQVSSPIELWNIKNRAYLDLKTKVSCPVINLTYESILRNPEAELRQLAISLNLEFKGNGRFKNIESSTKESGSTFKEYQDYYLNSRFMNHFTIDTIEYVNERLDKSILSSFKYQLVSSLEEIDDAV